MMELSWYVSEGSELNVTAAVALESECSASKVNLLDK